MDNYYANDSDAANLTSCTECPDYSTVDAGLNTTCVCDDGYYSDGNTVVLACTPCDTGFTTDSDNATECTVCLSTYKADADPPTTCTPCASNAS